MSAFSQKSTRSVVSPAWDSLGHIWNGEPHQHQQQSQRFSGEVQQLAEDIALYSSFDGVIWYARVKNRCGKIVIFWLSLAAIFALPIYISIELADFITDTKVINAIEWRKTTSVEYPNITVCNSRYFSNTRLRDYNVSNDLANYMSMVMDINLKEFTDFVGSEFFPTGKIFRRAMADFELELDTILARNNFTLFDLFTKTAISCYEFVEYCEIHGTYAVSPNRGFASELPYCCDVLFDQRPFFTPAGTCYTSNASVVEYYANSLSSVKIWLDAGGTNLPKYSMTWRGSDAAERTGAVVTLTTRDHPASQLLVNPIRMAEGTSTLIGISMEEVQRDDLKGIGKKCLRRNETFQQIYGVESTKLNCDLLVLHYIFPNCSMAVYFGYRELPGRPPCKPKDLLSGIDPNVESLDCPYDCFETTFAQSTSWTGLNWNAMNEFFNNPAVQAQNGAAVNVTDILVLKLFMNTFDVRKDISYQESFIDFLSKIGGIMGLVVGASIISLIEVVYFVFSFLRIIFRNMFFCVANCMSN